MHCLCLGLLAATAPLLTACGSSPSAHGKVDPSFSTEFEHLCSENLSRYPVTGKFPYTEFDPQLPTASQLPAVGQYFAQNQRGFAALQAAVGHLRAPSTGWDSWNKVKASILAYLANATAQKNAALQGNAAAFVASVKEAQPIADQLTAAVRQAGLPVTGPCAQVF